MKMLRALLLATAAASAPGAHAATCSISAQPVSFGSYDPLAATNNDAVGQVSVTCSNTISLTLSYAISLSTGTSASYAARKMAAGANRLNYNLYTDLTRLIVWGDATAGTSKVSSSLLLTALGVTANHTVYGRVPARQNVAVGVYSDTITATVEY